MDAPGPQDFTSDSAPEDVLPKWPSGGDAPHGGIETGTAAGGLGGSECFEMVSEEEGLSPRPPSSNAGYAALCCDTGTRDSAGFSRANHAILSCPFLEF